MAGALLTMASTFGQTYFITLFGAQLRSTFSLSHGEFGFVYMVATLASAITLVWAGQLADRMRLKTLGLSVTAGLMLATLFISQANSWIWLVISLYMLRLFGQGMMSHVAMTAMARWFNAHRGRALSIASLGHAAGEAVLPGLAVAAMVYAGWRETWLMAAGVIGFVIIPVFYFLTAKERHRNTGVDETGGEGGVVHWTRRAVLKDWLFYAMLPGTLAPSFITTVVFFHQAHLVHIKDWSMVMWSGFYPFFALSTTVVSLITGWAIDRWSARQLLPVYLLPQVVAMVIFAYGESQFSGLAGMIAIGCTVGAAATMSGAVWAELYGTRYLGSIKALTTAGAVLATAVGPGLSGYLMDKGINLETILLVMGMYSVMISVVFVALMPVMLSDRKSTLNNQG